MKKILTWMLALAMMLGLCGVALAEDDVLVIYSARNERLNNIVIPAFEAKTGIKVEMITGSSGEVLQRGYPLGRRRNHAGRQPRPV